MVVKVYNPKDRDFLTLSAKVGRIDLFLITMISCCTVISAFYCFVFYNHTAFHLTDIPGRVGARRISQILISVAMIDEFASSSCSKKTY